MTLNFPRRRAATLAAILALCLLAAWSALSVQRTPAPAWASAPRPGAASPLTRPGAPSWAVLTGARQPAGSPSAPGRPSLAAARVPSAPAGCLPFDISCQINTYFASIDVSFIQSMLRLIGGTELTTSDVTALPAVQAMSLVVLGVSDALFLLLILAGGGLLMGYHTYQGSYTVKEVAPRLVIAMVASNSSLLLVSKAIGLSNAVSRAISGGALPSDAANQLSQTLVNDSAQGNIAVLLLILVAAILAVVIAITYVIRLMGLVLLVAMAPLALSGYALPHTSWAPRWWWHALAVVLVIPPAQALTLNAAMHVFFLPSWPGLSASPAPSAATVVATRATAGVSAAHALTSPDLYLINVLTAICLLYILARIPFWLSRPLLNPFGRSPIRSALRFAFGAAVLSRVGRGLRPASRKGSTADGDTRRRRAGGGTGRAGGGGTRPAGHRNSAGGTTTGSGNGAGAATRRAPLPTGSGTGTSGPAAGGTPSRPSGQSGPPGTGRHAAPPALPDGSRPYTARHAAPPPLPAGSNPVPRVPGNISPAGRHRRIPPLPAASAGASGRHATPPPPPAGQTRLERGTGLPADQVLRARPASPPVPRPPRGRQRAQRGQPRGSGRQPRQGPRS